MSTEEGLTLGTFLVAVLVTLAGTLPQLVKSLPDMLELRRKKQEIDLKESELILRRLVDCEKERNDLKEKSLLSVSKIGELELEVLSLNSRIQSMTEELQIKLDLINTLLAVVKPIKDIEKDNKDGN